MSSEFRRGWGLTDDPWRQEREPQWEWEEGKEDMAAAAAAAEQSNIRIGWWEHAASGIKPDWGEDGVGRQDQTGVQPDREENSSGRRPIKHL